MTNISSSQNIYIQQDGSVIKYKLGLSGLLSPLSFPCTINNTGTPVNITVNFLSDLSFNNSNQHFICGSSNIIFDGNNITITLDGITNYPGLIQNGTNISDGYNNITVQGFIVSTINGSGLSSEAGYICQSYFSKNKVNNIIQNCSSDGIIQGIGVGGICGRFAAYSTGNLTIRNCSSTGAIFGVNYSGGICGSDAGSGDYDSGIIGTVSIINCYSLGDLTSYYGGGICGFNAGNVNINNCYSFGAIGNNTNITALGGIVGGYSGWNGGNTVVENCYSFGEIIAGSAGIVGNFATSTTVPGGRQGTLTIRNCYSIGNIVPGFSISYGICGDPSPSGIGVINIYNCYTIGQIGLNCYGIANTSSPAITITSSFASGTGIWSDTTANTYLTGTPTTGSPIVFGSVWNSINPNTPYLLASFNNSIYDPSSVTTSALVGGIYTTSQGLFQEPGVLYELVNNTDGRITIDSNNGVITFNLGVSATYDTYTTNAFVRYGSPGPNYYGYNFNSFTLIYESPPIPPIPIANICFPENTPICVDQGIIPIQNIDVKKHTINKKKIIAITKTISNDSLVCFEKNSLKINYPTERTFISKCHKLLYAGKMIEANYFVKKFDCIKTVKYDGKILYNILMESHEIVNVNGLLCETLNPTNPVALLYNKLIDSNLKNNVAYFINKQNQSKKPIKNANLNKMYAKIMHL